MLLRNVGLKVFSRRFSSRAAPASGKSRLLSTAAALCGVSMAAGQYAFAKEEEMPVQFNKDHYSSGLNGSFTKPGAVEKFAGPSVVGGGGRFEDPKVRDIAAAKDALAGVFAKYGVSKGNVIIDVGAGTGLFLQTFSDFLKKFSKSDVSKVLGISK